MWAIREFKGRFGNQLLLYATLRQKAKSSWQCVEWPGNVLFGLVSHPVEGKHIQVTRFPYNSGDYNIEFFRKLYDPTVEVRMQVEPPITALKDEGHTLIGIHLRRGDYGTFRRASAKWCFVAPCHWYVDWLKANLRRFHKPMLVLCSDDLNAITPEFQQFNSITMEPAPDFAPYYADHFALSQCDVMLTSNSTFSFTASMLNTNATEFWRPRLGTQCLVQYDPTNAPVVFKDESYE